MKEKVEEVLNRIRPYLQADGGDVELVEVNEETKVVKVRLTGACGHCPSSTYTLKMGIEQMLKEEVPEVESVEAVPTFF
ncbi:MAG: NifU family protein [Deltaproteobacteria bacterium]|nr:NifU family protein [Deltaproteobacteria bacterium]